MAAQYQTLLDDGGGGVFVALTAESLVGPERVAVRLGLGPVRSASGAWRFLSFPRGSPAAAVFLSAGAGPVQDPDSLLAHVRGVEALEGVWVEGGEPVALLLAGLGATSCGTAIGPGGARGVRWGLARGGVVLVPARPGARPGARRGQCSARRLGQTRSSRYTRPSGCNTDRESAAGKDPSRTESGHGSVTRRNHQGGERSRSRERTTRRDGSVLHSGLCRTRGPSETLAVVQVLSASSSKGSMALSRTSRSKSRS